eukprot:8056102-Karenia_brevis.AAC.1
MATLLLFSLWARLKAFIRPPITCAGSAPRSSPTHLLPGHIFGHIIKGYIPQCTTTKSYWKYLAHKHM